VTGPALLGAAEIRRLAAQLQIRPSKTLGQNFVVDANTVRRIVRTADLPTDTDVLEVGPGLGSLTLGLLAEGHRVTAVEIDPRLAGLLPQTVAQMLPAAADRLTVIAGDALRIGPDELPDPQPSALVANLPYNVAVPVVLGLLERLPTIRSALVMVQAEVAARLAAPPGSRTYGVPSLKLAWYADARSAGAVPRTVFWPVPNVDSALVSIRRRPEPPADRQLTFSLIDAAFAQRRKSLRAALAGRYGSAPAAESALRAAGLDPSARGEMLSVTDFARLAAVSEELTTPSAGAGGGGDFQA
jgi:16S rRNA (adenine1518-N6/adenine1519-N6)-dimethyltransferase